MSNQHESEEVIRFLTLYQALKKSCRDRPEFLLETELLGDDLKEICNELYWLSEEFEGHLDLVDPTAPWMAPVSKDFINAWRDFNQRFLDSILEVVWGRGYLEYLEAVAEEEGVDKALSRERKFDEMNFRHSAMIAETRVSSLDAVFSAASEYLRLGQGACPDETLKLDSKRSVEQGVALWNELNSSAPFDLEQYFRRQGLIPRILVRNDILGSPYVAHKNVAFSSLNQVIQAFLWGADLAAIAMIRSTIEMILSKHYGGQGSLDAMIDSVADRLPQAANRYVLHYIRKLANKILHGDEDVFSSLKVMNGFVLEKEIIRFVVVIRELIEAAPE